MGWLGRLWPRRRINEREEQAKAVQQRFDELAEKADAVGEQLQKLARWQYKSAQDAQTRFEQLGQALEQNRQEQEERQQLQQQTAVLEQQLLATARAIIRWIDDLDHLLSGLPRQDNEHWVDIFRRWTAQLTDTLAAINIHELEAVDRSFDPAYMEAVGTVSADDGYAEQGRIVVPYQVVSVVRRGFRLGRSTVLRKAQVITYQSATTQEESL